MNMFNRYRTHAKVWTHSIKYEDVFLEVIGTKILRLLLHAIHSHLHQLISKFVHEWRFAEGQKGSQKPQV